MPIRPPNRSSAVAILATSVVVCMGLASVTFIVLAYAEKPAETLAIVGGCTLAAWFMLWWLTRPKPEGLSQHAYLLDRREPKLPSNWKVRKMRTSSTPDEKPAPPTAERVRELSGGVNTWVPSGRYKPRNEPPTGKK